MSIFEHFQNAIRSIRVNKMRTVLSSLGIIIGVASVIVLLAFGEGTQRSITSNIESLWTNLLTLSPGRGRQWDVRQTNSIKTSDLFTMDDVATIQKIQWVSMVAPQVSTQKQVIVGTKNVKVSINGVTPSYAKVKNINVQYGDFISLPIYQKGITDDYMFR